MTRQVDIERSRDSLREFIKKLGTIREPVELVSGGSVVARITGPSEMSEAEKEQILRDTWQLVDKARAHSKGVPEKELAKAVDAAVKRVRSKQ